MNSYDVDPNALIEAVAKKLQKDSRIKPPEWASMVKTGVHKERPPTREDWWHVRAAAVLRTVNQRGPIGVEKLRTKYGGKKNRGHKPDIFRRGSGNILRTILQQLQESEYVSEVKKGIRKGRIITGKGRSLLDKAAEELEKTPKQVPKQAPEQKAPEAPKEEISTKNNG